MPDEDPPRTFREVGIFLSQLKTSLKELKEEDLLEIKEEVEAIKKLMHQLMGVVFTALIGPILVGIILAYVIPSR